jgi:N-acetylglucosaminyldiphosphoundecaprenol N-acetyl-beta-D-mannosaminyltransferase
MTVILDTPDLTLTPTPRISLLGIDVDNVTMDEAIRAILERLDPGGPYQVAFINADCVNIACRHAEYRRVLGRASLAFADGVGLKLAGLALGRPVRDNVNGTDMLPPLCEALAREGKSLYLLGAKPGVADDVRQWMHCRFPEIRVAGCRHGYFTPEEEAEVVRDVARSKADLLLVAFGAPRQELWIDRHLDELGVRVAIGVGGLFDFYSGRIPRAPLWIRRIGMEWLFRMGQEPGRLWRRYLLGNPLFLARVFAARLGFGSGAEGEQAVIAAYREVDGFET